MYAKYNFILFFFQESNKVAVLHLVSGITKKMDFRPLGYIGKYQILRTFMTKITRK